MVETGVNLAPKKPSYPVNCSISQENGIDFGDLFIVVDSYSDIPSLGSFAYGQYIGKNSAPLLMSNNAFGLYSCSMTDKLAR